MSSSQFSKSIIFQRGRLKPPTIVVLYGVIICYIGIPMKKLIEIAMALGLRRCLDIPAPAALLRFVAGKDPSAAWMPIVCAFILYGGFLK